MGERAERHQAIRGVVDDEGFASVQDLSARFGVSTVTVRADLDALDGLGGLQRVRGGAVRRRARPEVSFELASTEAGPAKRAIARRAVAQLSSGDTVMLDVGTTTTAIAHELVHRSDLDGLTVFTNSLTIPFELEQAAERIRVVVTGGTLRPLQHSLVDPLATLLLDGINAHVAFVGCNGVHPDAGITNVNLPETAVKWAMLRAARRRVVVADGSKVGEIQLAGCARWRMSTCWSPTRAPTGKLSPTCVRPVSTSTWLSCQPDQWGRRPAASSSFTAAMPAMTMRA